MTITIKEKLIAEIEKLENNVKDAKARIEELFNDLARQDLRCTLFNHLVNNKHAYFINNIEIVSFQDNTITLCLNFEDSSYTMFEVELDK